MRLINFLGIGEDRHDDVAGVTIDVMTGIVAGVALVLAILILASSLRHAEAGLPSGPVGIEHASPGV